MKSVNKIMNVFKKKEKEKSICYHNYVDVESVGIYEVYKYREFYFLGSKRKAEEFCEKHTGFKYRELFNVVCTKCGECFDAEEYVLKYFDKKHEEMIKKKEEKELATKIWNERCCK